MPRRSSVPGVPWQHVPDWHGCGALYSHERLEAVFAPPPAGFAWAWKSRPMGGRCPQRDVLFFTGAIVGGWREAAQCDDQQRGHAPGLQAAWQWAGGAAAAFCGMVAGLFPAGHTGTGRGLPRRLDRTRWRSCEYGIGPGVGKDRPRPRCGSSLRGLFPALLSGGNHPGCGLAGLRSCHHGVIQPRHGVRDNGALRFV